MRTNGNINGGGGSSITGKFKDASVYFVTVGVEYKF